MMYRKVLVAATLAVTSVAAPAGPSSLALELEANISAAVLAGASQLNIPSGEFLFSNHTLKIQDARGLHITTAGPTTFIFYYGSGVNLVNCYNSTFEGITIDSETANFAQGLVTSVGSSSFEAEFDARYLAPNITDPASPFHSPGGLSGAKVAFWEPESRRLVQFVDPFPSASNQFMANASLVDGTSDQWRITLQAPVTGDPVENSTLVTIFPRRGLTWTLTNSSAIITRKISIFAGGNMGFVEKLGAGNNVYDRVSVSRPPTDYHFLPDRLMALNADGFHSDSVGAGPTLRDSEISFTGDDFLNIHNRMNVICKRLSTDALVLIDVAAGALADLGPGDELKFFQLNADSFIESAKISSVSRVPSDDPLVDECAEVPSLMQEPPYNANLLGITVPTDYLFVVHFDAPVSSIVSNASFVFNLVNDEQHSAVHALVANNHFHDGFSRMALLKSIACTYTGNTVERARGVHVYSEQSWLEGALGIRDTIIENNTIVDDLSGSIDVMVGLGNITCDDNVFIEQGERKVVSGC